MPVNNANYGLLASFDDPKQLVEAARCAHQAGYCHVEAYSPFPIDGLREALGHGRTILPAIIFAGGLTGAAAGFAIQYFTNALDYPLNVGGRPLNSWPAFTLPAFQVAILCAAMAAFLGMLLLNRLPRLHHPLFNVAEFDQASQTRFFLCIRSTDPMFDAQSTHTFLAKLNPTGVREVPT